MRSRPSSVRDQDSSGTRADGEGEGGAEVGEVGAVEGGFFLRMPLGGTGAFVFAGSSSMSGLRDCAAGDVLSLWAGLWRDVGTRTERGLSLPLDAMLGVPIWRERRRPYWASMRWKASSDKVRVSDCQSWAVG